MKTLFTKHKLLLFTLFAVLLLGVVSGLALSGAIRLFAGGSSFETVADARREQADPAETGAKTASRSEMRTEKPTLAPESSISFNAEEIRMIVEDVQMRRRYVIPIRTIQSIPDNRFLWTEEKPDAEQVTAAREAAERYCGILFKKTFFELTNTAAADARVQLFQDTTDDRDDFLRVTDYEESLIMILRASDTELICMDLLTYPEGRSTDREKENIVLAQELGYAAKPLQRVEGSPYPAVYHEIVYEYRTEGEECLTFSYIGDKLWQAAVYPSENAMFECEYFLADLQMDLSDPVYPKRFVPAEPDERAVSRDVIIDALVRLTEDLSGIKTDADDLKATFCRDESGAREDCWRILGGGFDVVVSAYSRNVITCKCNIPCRSILNIPYRNMGGEEYEAVTAKIAEDLIAALGTYDDAHGRTLKRISVNAVADGHFCTMDIELTDGTAYECYFYDGVLKEMWYYADDSMFYIGHTGWVADAVYTNKTTGKQYIPDYRDWDGDLHVIRPKD